MHAMTGTTVAALAGSGGRGLQKEPGMTMLAVRDIHSGATADVDVVMTAAQRFDAAVRPYLQALQTRALRITRDPEAANDLVQDTLERGFRKRDLFQPDTDLRAWLLSIMRNVWISSHRRRVAQPSLVSLEALDEVALHRHIRAGGTSASTVERSVVEQLGETAIMRMIQALPPGYRDVVVLADVEEVPYRLVAETLRIPVGSVCSRLSRARRQLRRAIGDQARPGSP
jgi:RNA polymerase sigma-70 factor (ECF subfamily)